MPASSDLLIVVVVAVPSQRTNDPKIYGSRRYRKLAPWSISTSVNQHLGQSAHRSISTSVNSLPSASRPTHYWAFLTNPSDLDANNSRADSLAAVVTLYPESIFANSSTCSSPLKVLILLRVRPSTSLKTEKCRSA